VNRLASSSLLLLVAACGARTNVGIPVFDASLRPLDTGLAPDAPLVEAGPLPDVTLDQTGCVLYGGFPETMQTSLADTWFYDGAAWTREANLIPAECEPAQCGYVGSAVTVADRIVFIGFPATTAATLMETFIFDGRRWTPVMTANPPPVRWYPAVAASGNDVLLFGGADLPAGGELNDTWVLRGNAWSQVVVDVAPPARSNATIAATTPQPARQLVLFGGSNSTGLLGDTWLWNGTAWTESHDDVGPTPRCGASAAATPGGVVLFGGCSSGGCIEPSCDPGAEMNDTWQWDGRWTRLHPLSPPPPRTDAASGSDDVGTMYVFGGYFGGKGLADTWVFDGTWASGDTGPSGRGLAAMACF
jgi:hypothetical protein